MALNTLYIVLGVAGILQPTASAILHNGTTVVLTAANTRNLVDPHRRSKGLHPGAEGPARSLPTADGEE